MQQRSPGQFIILTEFAKPHAKHGDYGIISHSWECLCPTVDIDILVDKWIILKRESLSHTNGGFKTKLN